MRRFYNNFPIFRTLLLAITVLLFCGSKPCQIQAASLSIYPSIVQTTVGDIVSVHVLVGTNGKNINNSDGGIIFPADMLQVISLGKNASIFSMWVEEPKFSNFEGKITWNGGVPNPGYNGENGEVLTINFKAKKVGLASVVFSDIAVRQNDGLGTDILSSKNVGTIEIKAVNVPKTVRVTPAPIPTIETLAAPIVTSPTHTNQEKWYANHDPEIIWEVLKEATSVLTLVDRNPDSVPTVVYEPPIDSKKITALEDGVWYFHVRFKNKNTNSQIAHFKIQNDTVAPNPFKVTYKVGNSDDLRQPVSFSTTDILSGIDHYEVKIDGGEYSKVITKDVLSDSYSTPVLAPGQHDITIKAVDRAGNVTTESSKFTVEAVPVPQIKESVTQSTRENSWAMNWVWLVILVAITTGLLILLTVYLLHNRRIKINQSDSASGNNLEYQNSFNYLRGKVSEQTKILEEIKNKRTPTADEEKVLKELESALLESEEYVEGKKISKDVNIQK